MTVRLGTKTFEARLLPEAGGLVVALNWVPPSGRAVPLLYSPARKAPSRSRPNRFGLWPMLPFANRAYGGVLRDRDIAYQLPLNEPDADNTIHGFAWQRAWDIAAADTRKLTMTQTLGDSGGPYLYRAEMSVTLQTESVRFDLQVENQGSRPLPFGLGFHPWFPRAPGTRLVIAAKDAVPIGPDNRPAPRAPLPATLPLDGRAPLPLTEDIALSFIDAGAARLIDFSPGHALDITASENLRHPLLWAPAHKPFICLEPQSHCIGAPSLPQWHAYTPMARLAKGETMQGWMVLKPSVLG